MQFAQDALLHIVEQSRSLHERLNGQVVADGTCGDAEGVAQRFERWCQTAAAGNAAQFANRLRWEGWDLPTVRAALDQARYHGERRLPAWAHTLEAIMAQAASIGAARVQAYTSLNPEAPLPFEEMFLPFLEVARQQLAAQAQDQLLLLSPQARTRLEVALLGRLARVCFRTLTLEFSVFRASHQHSGFTSFIGQLQGASSRQLYTEFISGMFAGKLVPLLTEYPVLARLTAQIVDFWVEASTEFLQHLAADLPQIQETFAVPVLGRVEAVQSALSDPHYHGRSVLGVQFASGVKLIYKPKDLATEAHFFGLLAWLNQQQELLPLRVLQVINRGSHGWVEWAEASPCQDATELTRYYRRSGMLLGLVYALRGSDFHYENTLACGEQPVLVDLEILLAPVLIPMASHGQDNAQLLAAKQVHESVLSTGLLPRWLQSLDQDLLDVSGLGAIDVQAIKTITLRHVNTDNMGLAEDTATISNGQNSPFAPDVPGTVRDYIEDIVMGFRDMYHFLLQHRQTLLTAPSPLTDLVRQRYRFLYRNTMLYAALLAKSCQPKLLRHGVERSIALEALCRALLKSTDKPPLWPVVAAEQQALERLDIPVFMFRSDSTTLEAAGMAPIPAAFSVSGYDAMCNRLRHLNREDLERQVALIRGSLYARVLVLPAITATNGAYHPGMSLPRQQLLETASNVGQELARRAIRAADGSVCWIGMHYDALTNHYCYQALDSGLYNGTPGVAVFLAALAHVTATATFRDLALSACTVWQQTLAEVTPDTQPRIVRAMGLGAGNGVASTAYALATVSQLLEAPALLETAQQTAVWLTVERLQADTHFDILYGAAGVLLVLLKLYRLTGASDCLDRAIVAGQHLVTHRLVDENGACTWKTTYPRMLSGFSQGAAGIAYALLQLFAVTGDYTYYEVAKGAMAYENTAFAADVGNWYDYRPFTMRHGQPTCMTSWCHGAPGIGLARLASLPVLDTADIQRDIEVALCTTQQASAQGVDHLCCGNAGRIDVLLTASHKLLRPELRHRAQQLTAWIVQRAQHEGTFCLYANVPSNVYNPALFQGTAGIGYTLLRVAEPEALPSLLLWE